MYQISDDKLTMQDLLAQSEAYIVPEIGSVITGKVVNVRKNRVVVDLNGVAVGIIKGRETQDAAGTMQDLAVGDEVKAVVIDQENEDGMVVLSLQKASQANTWDRFENAFKTGEIIDVVINEANKGGLLLEVDGVKGFIPVSQLAPMHYPRVDGADAGEILRRLQKLISQKLQVKVINLDRATGKMILSEKAAASKESNDRLKNLKPGDAVHGKVSGVVKFGIFVTFDGLEGLVHISEIAWGHVSDPHQYAHVGDPVDVQIIGIEGDKLSFSIKRLTPDPWEAIAKKYPIGTKVKGTVSRFSQYGAFIQLEDDITGLIHLSEISDAKVEDPKDFLAVGEAVEAEVINIDSDERRIGLSIKVLKGGAKKLKRPKSPRKLKRYPKKPTMKSLPRKTARRRLKANKITLKSPAVWRGFFDDRNHVIVLA